MGVIVQNGVACFCGPPWCRSAPVVEAERPAGDGRRHVAEGVVTHRTPHSVVTNLQSAFPDYGRRIGRDV